METQPLGRSDVRVSRVGLGCNNFGSRIDFERTREVVEAALESGVTFFDTADVYGNGGDSERFLGELLEGRREQAVVATKFGGDMETGDEARGSRDYIRRALDASLSRLRTTYVDLYYYHWPDKTTPLEETVAAMQELVDEGLVRAIGVSNWDGEMLRRGQAVAPIAAVQNRYSLLERDAEQDALPAARELGIGFIPYFPLASGLLTGKYRRGQPPPEGTRLHGRDEVLTDEKFDEIERLERFAGDRGRTLLELAIAGLASQPGIPSVIAGATSAEQVRANAAAADWQLDDAALDELLRR